MQLSPTLRAELAKLDAAGIIDLLGEILEPSIKSPITVCDDAFDDALHPVKCAFIDAYDALTVAASPAIDPDAALYARADYLYECARDARMERELGL